MFPKEPIITSARCDVGMPGFPAAVVVPFSSLATGGLLPTFQVPPQLLFVVVVGLFVSFVGAFPEPLPPLIPNTSFS